MPAMLKLAVLLAATLAGANVANSKRGVLYSEDPVVKIAGTVKNYPGLPSQINWIYNTHQTTSRRLPGVEFVPTMYGVASLGGSPQHRELAKNTDLSKWAFNVEYWLQHGTKHLLSMDISQKPAEAVKMWMTHLQPYAKRGVKLGAPMMWPGDEWFDWLDEFQRLCKGKCTMDFFPITIYVNWDQYFNFQASVREMCSLAKGKPVWVAAFGVTTPTLLKGIARDDDPDLNAFIKKAMVWLDNQPCVARYFFDGANGATSWLLRKDADDHVSPAGPELSTLGYNYCYARKGSSTIGS